MFQKFRDGRLGSEVVRQTGWHYVSRKKDGMDFRGLQTYAGQTIYHDYTPVYYELFKDRRDTVERLLEVGIWEGASHRMWAEFFPDAVIFGLDNFSGLFHKYKQENPSLTNDDVIIKLNELKNSLENDGIIVYVGDQTDRNLLKNIGYDGKYDIIIDDGGHHSVQVQVSFDILWDFVKPGGYYIVEDLAVCFMREFREHDDPRSSSLEFIKSLANNEPFSYYIEQEKLNRIHSEIASIQFSGELGIIQKK